MVVGPAADLDADLDRILTPRIFNSGQDCAGPDAYLVHQSRLEEFVECGREAISYLPIGDYRTPDVRVGPVLNPRPLPDLRDRLASLQEAIVAGGVVDIANRTVEATLVVRDLADHDHLFEFFAPVFYVLSYETAEELQAFFAAPTYRDYAMYASFFGEVPPPGIANHSTVLVDHTVLEVEQGNAAYGGGGPRANFVTGPGETYVGPILVSEALTRARLTPSVGTAF